MVFYRKYRSQTLDELIGQDQVKKILKSSFLSNKLAHAYLLCGPRGTGKTSTARIIAKMVNCEKSVLGKEAENVQIPCNECLTCLSITDGSNLDLIEIDAASNRGIDDIRSLRENIKLAPSASKKKVYIIDEVHMLTGEAFNALLKTLEEPPSHALFILATTEAQKIPATIMSRVQRLDFKAATISELKEALQKVVKAEKLDITEEALLLIAKKAQGSFRDGIKFLDQLSALSKIDAPAVEENLGTGVWEGAFLILESIAQSNASEALQKLTKQIDKGIGPKELNTLILEILRQLMLVKNNLGEQLVKVELGSDIYPKVVTLADKFTLDHLLAAIGNFQLSFEQSKYVAIPTLPLEVAVVESTNTSLQTLEKKEKEEKIEEIKTQKNNDPEPASLSNITSSDLPDEKEVLSESSDIQKITDRWTYILETVRAYNFSLEALLRSSKIKECQKELVLIEVPYSFHQRILDAPKSKDILESILSDVLGRVIRVTTALGQKPVQREELANVEIAQDDEIVKLASEIFNSDTVN